MANYHIFLQGVIFKYVQFFMKWNSGDTYTAPEFFILAGQL
jgi:hypothetical protein